MEKEILLDAIKQCSDNFQHRVTKQKVGEFLGCSYETIRYYIKKYNLTDKDYWRNLPKKYIHLFDEINNLSSYWLGYLQADGCVDDKRLILECNFKDKIILENFCDDANLSYDRISERIRFEDCLNHSVRLDLAKTCFNTFPNISRRKTYLNEHLPENIYFWPFLEGLFHGDGCFGTSQGGHQIMILIRDPMCSEIMDKLQETLPSPSSVWKNPHPTTSNLFNLVIGTGRKSRNEKMNNHYFIHSKWREAIPISKLPRKEEKIIQSLSRYFNMSPL